MTTLTPELVNRYIASAQPFVESKTDRLALQRAIELNAPPKLRQRNPRGKYIGDMYFAAYVDKAAVKVESLQTAIWAEIHAALCKKTARYRKHADVIRDNVHLLSSCRWASQCSARDSNRGFFEARPFFGPED
jgi:hypothetical protein